MTAHYIIGVDECGVGAYAGPVTVGAVAYPITFKGHDKIKDCKKFSSFSALKAGVEVVKQTAESYSFAMRFKAETYEEFSDFRDLAIIRLAEKIQDMLIADLVYSGQYDIEIDIILDGQDLPDCLNPDGTLHMKAMPKADSKVPAVAAASMVAKLARDEYMLRIAKDYPPEFRLESNKGYHTRDHMDALKKYGALDIHHPYIHDVKQAIASKGFWNGKEAVEGH